MGENYGVDFAEVEFPLDQSEEFARLEFMMDKGLMDRTDLIRHFNPDISDEDLEKLMNRDMWIHPKIEGKKRNNTPTPSWKEQIDKGMIKYAKK